MSSSRAISEDAIPSFRSNGYTLDDRGVFVRNTGMAYHDLSKPEQGLVPSTTLRKYVLYHQCGQCLECGIPEWATSARLHLHRLQSDGLYSIHNVVALCVACHAAKHSNSRVDLVGASAS
jgi:5-methylcytosine-specific restriction endonuclease McrA